MHADTSFVKVGFNSWLCNFFLLFVILCFLPLPCYSLIQPLYCVKFCIPSHITEKLHWAQFCLFIDAKMLLRRRKATWREYSWLPKNENLWISGCDLWSKFTRYENRGPDTIWCLLYRCQIASNYEKEFRFFKTNIRDPFIWLWKYLFRKTILARH